MRNLVLAYFERLGASIWELGDDVYRVELTPEQSGELEGGWTPPWMLRQGAQVTHYFTFTPEVAEANDDVELIGLGSHRLTQVIESIKRIGCAARVWLPAGTPGPDPRSPASRAIFYRPFYLFTLRLDFDGTTKPAEIRRIAVDRVDQIALLQLAAILPDLPLESGFPVDTELVDRPAADFARCFQIAFESILQALEMEDPLWAIEAQRAIDLERERLDEYYSERERAGDDVQEERARRLGELDAARPKVVVRVQGVSELFLPVSYERGVARHVAFDMAAYRGMPMPSRR